MKVFSGGKEVKGAELRFYEDGSPQSVVINGVAHDPALYELKEQPKSKKGSK